MTVPDRAFGASGTTRSPAGRLNAGSRGFSSQNPERGAHNRLGGDAEVVVDVLGWRTRAEAGHADKGAVGADELVPAEADGGLDRDVRGCAADGLAAVALGLRAETFSST
jgi:hypothetical protein